MTIPDHMASDSSEHDSAPDPAPGATGSSGVRAEELPARGMASGARRDELGQIRRAADARFDQLRDSVEVRLGGIEQAADAALDDHWDWDNSGWRFSRVLLIVLGALWIVCLALFLFSLSGAVSESSPTGEATSKGM